MAKIALYRKYRPQDFSEVEGQEHVVMTLQNAVKTGAFSHAYIFCGPRGIGKTTVARILAKAVNCKMSDSRRNLSARSSAKEDGNDKWDGNPCNKCDACVSINNQTALDIMEIDAASNRGIDEIRDLREKVKFTPSELSYKVFIIDEVHMLTREAFNALLKTLEEPPAHALFIMATTEIHKIPATVISRSQRFDFKRITGKDLEKRITEIAGNEKIKIDKSAVSLIAKASEGGLRDAISIFDQVSMNVKNREIKEEDVSGMLGFADISKMKKLADYIKNNDKKEALELLEEIIGRGADIGQLTKALLESFRDEIKQSLESNDLARLIYAVDTLSSCNKEFKHSLYPQLSLEVAIVKISDWGNRGNDLRNKEANPKAEKQLKSEKKQEGQETATAVENTQVSAKWKQVLYEIKLKNNSIHAFVKESEPIFKDDEIQLVFPYKFHKQRIEDRRNKAIVEKAISKVCGRDFDIICILEKRPSASKKEDTKTIAQEAKEEAGDDLLGVLGGEVIG